MCVRGFVCVPVRSFSWCKNEAKILKVMEQTLDRIYWTCGWLFAGKTHFNCVWHELLWITTVFECITGLIFSLFLSSYLFLLLSLQNLLTLVSYPFLYFLLFPHPKKNLFVFIATAWRPLSCSTCSFYMYTFISQGPLYVNFNHPLYLKSSFCMDVNPLEPVGTRLWPFP